MGQTYANISARDRIFFLERCSISSPTNRHPLVVRRASMIENNPDVRRMHWQVVVSGFAVALLLVKPRRDDLRSWNLVYVGSKAESMEGSVKILFSTLN